MAAKRKTGFSLKAPTFIPPSNFKLVLVGEVSPKNYSNHPDEDEVEIVQDSGGQEVNVHPDDPSLSGSSAENHQYKSVLKINVSSIHSNDKVAVMEIPNLPCSRYNNHDDSNPETHRLNSYSNPSMPGVSNPRCPPPIIDMNLRYVCSRCGKRFTTGSNRTRHENTHSKNYFKPVCVGCGKSFTRKCKLKKHLNIYETCRQSALAAIDNKNPSS